MAWPVSEPSLSSFIRLCGQMYMQAVLSCPLQPSHFSVRTKVGIWFLLLGYVLIIKKTLGKTWDSDLSAGRMPGQLDLDLLMLGQAGVVGAQHLQHLRSGKFAGHIVAFGQHLAQLG